MISSRTLRFASALLCLPLIAVPSSFAWGHDGHLIINRLAVETLPADLPAFMHTPEAISEIEYLGPEPDRWRSRAEPELSAEQGPDHFIDLEWADMVGMLPRQRYLFITDLYAAAITHPDMAVNLQPAHVGFQPYITNEVWERLKSAMRDYRDAQAQHEDTKPIEAKILFYAGWLGHYVADGSQPLHVTINYDGWVEKDNPNGYTTAHGIHSKFETQYVSANIKAADVQPLMTPVHPIGDEWDDYLAYLRHTATFVDRVYQLDKQQGFDGAGTPEAKQFTAERLAAGASMLRDLIAAAWVKSAEPVPEWHAVGGAPKAQVLQAAPPGTNGGFTGGPPPFASAPPPFHVGNGVTAPVLRHLVDPQYSDEAREAAFGGVVLVRLVVDEKGMPQDIRVFRPLGMGLDEKAVEAVRQYRFAPATYKNKPVPVEIDIDVDFRPS